MCWKGSGVSIYSTLYSQEAAVTTRMHMPGFTVSLIQWSHVIVPLVLAENLGMGVIDY
jgi:hypothetical protein